MRLPWSPTARGWKALTLAGVFVIEAHTGAAKAQGWLVTAPSGASSWHASLAVAQASAEVLARDALARRKRPWSFPLKSRD